MKLKTMSKDKIRTLQLGIGITMIASGIVVLLFQEFRIIPFAIFVLCIFYVAVYVSPESETYVKYVNDKELEDSWVGLGAGEDWLDVVKRSPNDLFEHLQPQGRNVEWDDLDFSNVFGEVSGGSDTHYVPSNVFRTSIVVKPDNKYITDVASKIVTALEKKNVKVSLSKSSATTSLLTLNLLGQDSLLENGIISYFDINKVTSALPNIKTALGTKTVTLNPFTGTENEFALTVSLDNNNQLALGNLYSELSNKKMEIIVGETVEGKLYKLDLAKAPHTLIVGSTGSGKSTFVRSIITQLVTTRNNVKLFLSDVKQTELVLYSGLPNTEYFASNYADTVKMLDHLVQEMHKRNKLLRDVGVTDIDGYNKKVEKNKQLSYCVTFIEEFLMLSEMDQNELVKSKLMTLLAGSRSAGIQINICCQTALAKIIPTELRSNLPVRFVLKLANKSENATVGCDGFGLAGDGDLYVVEKDTAVRCQAPYISVEEVTDIVKHLRGG